MIESHDPSLDALLNLDGETFFIDDAGDYHVRFIVKKVPVTPDRPHGLSYSLTLHDRKNERLIGFDNAHPVSAQTGPAARTRQGYDHKHRHTSVRPYEYKDAASLLADFWHQVDDVLKEKGVRL